MLETVIMLPDKKELLIRIHDPIKTESLSDSGYPYSSKIDIIIDDDSSELSAVGLDEFGTMANAFNIISLHIGRFIRKKDVVHVGPKGGETFLKGELLKHHFGLFLNDAHISLFSR